MSRPPAPTGERVRTGSPFAARAVAVVAALVAALVAVLAPAAVLAPPAAADTSPDPTPTLRLQALSPSVAHPGDELEVVVQVANPTSAVLEGARVDLWVHWRRQVSRSALEDWVAGDETRPTGARQAFEDLPALPPGANEEITLRVPVDALELQDTVAGPVNLAVTVRSEDGERLAQLRTFLLFDPERSDEVEPGSEQVRLSLLTAITGPAVDPADPTSTTDLVGRTGAGSALTLTSAAVDVAQQATGVPRALAVAVDPALVATALESDNTQVATWAQGVARLGDVTEVHPLPAYDPDLAALAHAGLGAGGIAGATSTPLPGGWSVPSTWSAPLAWPVGPDAPDIATLAAGRAAGLDTVVVESGLAPNVGTPTGLATVATDQGDVTALVADPRISQLLADATHPTITSVVSPAEALQRLLAETAVVSAQNPDDPPHLLAVLPRGWAPHPDALRTVLSALSATDWVEIAPLADLLTAPVPTDGRHALEPSAPQDAEMSPDDVHRLDAARSSLADLATVTADPAAILAPLAATLAAPLSNAWRADPEGRADAVTTAVLAVNEFRGSSLTVSATDVTLISDAADLPILVTNALPSDATVTVVLSPDTPRLVIDSHPTVVVPANGQSRVPVPVRALGSGDVQVTVEVLTPAGAYAAAPITMQLRVQAGWETAGTWVTAVGVALLFVLGIWRTVRRGRSARRTVDEAVTDPVIHGDAERA